MSIKKSVVEVNYREMFIRGGARVENGRPRVFEKGHPVSPNLGHPCFLYGNRLFCTERSYKSTEIVSLYDSVSRHGGLSAPYKKTRPVPFRPALVLNN